MKQKIPQPTLTRLCVLYRFLWDLEAEGIQTISSGKIAQRLGYGSHNVRKDLSCLTGEIGNSGSGYDVVRLKQHLATKLGLKVERKACVVGLGRLGSAIMDYEKFLLNGYQIMAGFDSNINRVETIETSLPVYPAREIVNVVRRDAIELAVVAVPAGAAQEVADKLIEGGIHGIVNFAPVVLRVPEGCGVFIRNVDVINEFRILSALISLEK